MHYMPKPKPTFVWIYHKDLPDGRMIPTQDAIENKQQLLDDGYVDTPEKLDLPKTEPKPVTANNVAEASKLSDDDFISLFLNRGDACETHPKFVCANLKISRLYSA